jgi:hypothetical protein
VISYREENKLNIQKHLRIVKRRPTLPGETLFTDKAWLHLNGHINAHSYLSGVMISMLATGPKVHGFKAGQGNGFLRAIKICIMHQRGSKAISPMSQDFTSRKESL